MVWAREHRGELVWAMLVIARAWWAAGRPQVQVPTFGGFQEWTNVVGGILAHAGVSGFLGNLDRLYEEVDEGAPQFERFLRIWREAYGSTAMRVAQIAEDIRLSTSPLRGALPDTLAEFVDEKSKGKLAHRLGILLRRKVDVRHGSDTIRVERAGNDDHLQVGMWRVVSDDHGPEATPAPHQTPETPARPRNSPEIAECPVRSDDDGRRAWVLGMGEALGYPVVQDKGWRIIAYGKLAWENVCARSSNDHIDRAIAALQTLGEAGTP